MESGFGRFWAGLRRPAAAAKIVFRQGSDAIKAKKARTAFAIRALNFSSGITP
jgi:hypothetical protein